MVDEKSFNTLYVIGSTNIKIDLKTIYEFQYIICNRFNALLIVI